MQRASLELRKLLAELAAALDPFPDFMGLSSVQAVEVEPPRASNPQNGCVVVCPDGELRELVLRMIPGPFDMGGVEQTDEMAELDLAARRVRGIRLRRRAGVAAYLGKSGRRVSSPPRSTTCGLSVCAAAA